MIRIGVLLDSLEVQAWQELAIKEIVDSKIAKLEVLIVNRTPKSSGAKSPFLYRVFRKIDRMMFRDRLDAFQKKRIFETLDESILQIQVSPIQKTFIDIFPEESIEALRRLNLDILLRFGFRILKGEILTVAKLGIWSFHHGDPNYYRGGPPAFWEVMYRKPITSYVLMQLTENLDQGKILYQSWMQTDPLSVQRNSNRLFWASANAPVRVLKEIKRIGLDNWNEKISNAHLPQKAPLWKPPGSMQMLNLWISLVKRSIKRKWDEYQNQAQWQIGKVSNLSSDYTLSLNPLSTSLLEHPNPDRYFLADPFSIKFKGINYLFAEEFEKDKGKGKIVWISLSETGIQIHSVIEEDWHLSYPFLWKEKDQVFMIPESSDSGRIFLYQAIDFPLKWEIKGVLFEKEGYDPTLVKKDDIYWMFITQKAHPACWPFDELNLYWTEDLENPHWIAHPKNPIISDVRKARSAGRLFEKDGEWFRPAQDSGIRYGHRIKIQRIKTWTKQEYEEETLQIIQAESPALGIHTLNHTDSGTWVDFYFRK